MPVSVGSAASLIRQLVQNHTAPTAQQPTKLGADEIIKLAEADKKLSADEKQEIRAAISLLSKDGLDEEAKRLKAYLQIVTAGVRQEAARGAADGVVDLADAQALAKLVDKDGKLSGREKLSLGAAMVAFKMTDEARALLASKLEGKSPVTRVTSLADLPAGTYQVPVFGVGQTNEATTLEVVKSASGAITARLAGVPSEFGHDFPGTITLSDGKGKAEVTRNDSSTTRTTRSVNVDLKVENGRLQASTSWSVTGESYYYHSLKGTDWHWFSSYGGAYVGDMDPLKPATLQSFKTPVSRGYSGNDGRNVELHVYGDRVMIGMGNAYSYGGTLPVGPGGNIQHGKFTGNVQPDGSFTINRTEHFYPSYTESVTFHGRFSPEAMAAMKPVLWPNG
ncbi:MAG: hypothetical protein AB2A00_22530 [Myxococcota bacterium]